MKGMKKILMVLMVLSMVVVFAGQDAIAAWYEVNVVYSGIDDQGRCEIRVANDGGRERIFYAPTGLEKQYLAIALSAQSTSGRVAIDVDWSDNHGEMAGMRLVSQTP